MPSLVPGSPLRLTPHHPENTLQSTLAIRMRIRINSYLAPSRPRILGFVIHSQSDIFRQLPDLVLVHVTVVVNDPKGES